MAEIFALIKALPVIIGAFKELIQLMKDMNIQAAIKEIEAAHEAQVNAKTSTERLDAAVKLLSAFRGK